MKTVGFTQENIYKMWSCLFSKYYESNEIGLIKKLDDWSARAEDTDLSQLYMDRVKDTFYCNYPTEKNWLKDDILFHENRVYVFSKYLVYDSCHNGGNDADNEHRDSYLANITIIKPMMEQLEERDLFKKRQREKRDNLQAFEYTKDGKTEKMQPYLIKIPDDKECNFFERYIRVPNNHQKELDVLQNGRFVYFF